MITRTDAQLLASSDTDAAAFRELYDRYATPIGRFFLSRTRDREAALDLTSETFAELWRSRHRFEDRCNGLVGPWLFAIARHTLIRSVRRHRIETEARERLSIDVSGARHAVLAPDHWLDGLDADVDAALAGLPRSQQRAIALRVLADASYSDVADALDCSYTAARIKVSRGLAAMRAALDPPPDPDHPVEQPAEVPHERTRS
jgi:RNA polymerase sigma factor (sigma-70 family)